MFDDYLSDLGVEDREALQLVIDHVRRVAPDATEGRSYGVPAFRYRGKPLIGFAAAKTHLSLYPFSPTALDSVRDDLPSHKVSKGAVSFSAARPLPGDVLTKLLQARIAQIDGR